MSDSYTEINLDDAKPAVNDDLEIVNETEDAAPEPETKEPPSKPAAKQEAEEEDDGDDDQGSGGEGRKRPTRSQRLKMQRDAYARELAEERRKREDAEKRASRYEQDANEGASIGLDLLIQNIDNSMKALRRDFDAAFDSGDRDKIFEVQQRMAELTAERKQVEREKRTFPTKQAPAKSGSDTPPETQPTSQEPAKRTPNPAADEWFTRNSNWFNKDAVATAVAHTIDKQMVADGFNPSDPDYFDELDKRLEKEMPGRFGKKAGERPRANAPTVQNKSAAPPGSGAGKVRVVITQADRDMANHLGISIEAYAREKARREKAMDSANGYTEI